MRASLILSLAGTIVAFFGLSFILPILAGLIMGEDILNLLRMFGIPMVLCIAGGGFLYSYFHIDEDIRNREAFVLVSVVWIIMVIIGAIPYVVSEQMGLMSYEIGLVGALFESMSGLTTTGATMLEVPDGATIVNSSQYEEGYFDAPKSLLLWRSQTQWLGGMGIIVLATIIFSRLFGISPPQ
jgi:trk system potassium uptake protein TrkH